MRSKIKLIGDPIIDINTLQNSCSNNNQICYHLKNNQHIVDYLRTMTGLNVPIMVLFYHYKEGLKEIPKCDCGKNRQYHCSSYRPTCGEVKCKNSAREKSKKEFCLENYGVEFVTQLESMKEKSKSSCLKKFGVDNCTKSSEIIKKRTENNFKKYGVSDPIILESVRGNDSMRGSIKIQKCLPPGYKLINKDKLGIYYNIECPENHKFSISKYTLSNRKLDKVEICNQCNEYVGSKGEQDLYNYVSSIYNKDISRSNRKLIHPFEIDMVLDDIKLCIEFNGDYWHCDKMNDQYYHLNKLNMCLSKGYKLIQVRENDWNENKDIIKRKIYNIINNIIDTDDFIIEDSKLKIDLSWYDDRLASDENLINSSLPSLVKVGQYHQWDCGYKIYNYKK